MPKKTQMKQSVQDGLRLAYIAISKIEKQVEDRVFQRPLAHKAKLDLVISRLTLTSRQTQ